MDDWNDPKLPNDPERQPPDGGPIDDPRDVPTLEPDPEAQRAPGAGRDDPEGDDAPPMHMAAGL